MASALCDRARVVRRDATATRVDGGFVRRAAAGPWFRVRLTERGTPEGSPGDAVPRVRRGPELLFNGVDEQGGSVRLRPSDTVEVAASGAQEGAVTVWMVDGQPEEMRRKKGQLVGYLASVKRVDEAT